MTHVTVPNWSLFIAFDIFLILLSLLLMELLEVGFVVWLRIALGRLREHILPHCGTYRLLLVWKSLVAPDFGRRCVRKCLSGRSSGWYEHHWVHLFDSNLGHLRLWVLHINDGVFNMEWLHAAGTHNYASTNISIIDFTGAGLAVQDSRLDIQARTHVLFIGRKRRDCHGIAPFVKIRHPSHLGRIANR